jgi:hypothetical protein
MNLFIRTPDLHYAAQLNVFVCHCDKVYGFEVENCGADLNVY